MLGFPSESPPIRGRRISTQSDLCPCILSFSGKLGNKNSVPLKEGIVASEALEQSALEAKDREQLVAIAKALGVKSAARAKKKKLLK